MNIIAIDPSISSTAFSVFNTESKEIYVYCYSNKVKKDVTFKLNNWTIEVYKHEKFEKGLDYFERYYRVANTIILKLAPYLTPGAKIYIEGASFGSKGLLHNIGQFTGIIKNPIYVAGFKVKEIPPSMWKKRLTGKGNANKNLVYNTMLQTDLGLGMAEFVSRGMSYKYGSFLEDICDSYGILRYVMETNNGMG